MSDMQIGVNFGQAAGKIHNHFEAMPCPGPQACPHRLPPAGAPDAKEENEFYKDTGIRVGPSGRKLLLALKERHGHLRWRGSGSLYRMWQHHSLEYLDGDSELRITFSRLAWCWGWVAFFLGGLAELLFVLAMLPARSAQANPNWVYFAIGSLLFGLIMMAVAIEHMILPETMARKLKKRELAWNEAQESK